MRRSTPEQMTSTSALQKKQSLESTLSMGNGEGDDSYSKNSRGQGVAARDLLERYCSDALERVALPKNGPVVVADLGCASGSNSINNLTFIVDKLSSRSTASSTPLEFQIYFNDLPSNDFNNLFQHLTADPRHFFAAGVPGSFYKRLFPRSVVHLFFSSSSLHWLSKVPEAVSDRDSPAFNKGRFWINASSPAVISEFRKQALSDMINFLKARAEELVPGGALLVLTRGRAPTDANMFMGDPVMEAYFNHLDEAFTDLVSKGVITNEQLDTLNLPIYDRTLEDVQEAIDSCASDFHVQYLDMQSFPTNFVDVWETTDPDLLAKHIAGIYRGAGSYLVGGLIGQEASRLLWQQYEEIIRGKLVPQVLAKYQEGPAYDFLACVMVLIRK